MASIENLAPKDGFVVTPAATDLSGVVGLWPNEPGIATIVARRNLTLSIALAASSPFVMQIKQVTAWTGSAGSLIALTEI